MGKRLWTPARKAAHSAEWVYGSLIPCVASGFGLDISDPFAKLVVVVTVKGWSPREPFDEQRAYYRRLRSLLFNQQPTEVELRWKAQEKELSDWVWWMLKTGAEPSEVQALLDEEQVWTWMAVTASRVDLERALTLMYAAAWVEARQGGELDVYDRPLPIPGGMALDGMFYTR